MIVNSLESLLLGEAGGKNADERFADMLGIVSVIANRARSTNTTIAEVIAARNQFSAWGKALPPGVERYAPLAQRAIEQIARHGPITTATFYARPDALDRLPKGLKQESTTASHVYFTDPKGRAIGTTAGYVVPKSAPTAPVSLPATAPTPTSANAYRPSFTAPQLPDSDVIPAQAVQSVGVAARADPRAAVPAIPVQTTRISAVAAPTPARGITPGAGMANLAPNGVITNQTLANYDRTNLSPTLGPVLDALARTPGMETIGINSGHRSPSKNRAEGGAKSSQHMQGKALDLNVRGLTDSQKASLLDTAIERGAKGIGLYSSGNTIHVDTRANPAVWGPNTRNPYGGVPISQTPSWAHDSLNALFAAGPFAVAPRDGPIPTSREAALAAPPSMPAFDARADDIAASRDSRAPQADFTVAGTPTRSNFSGGMSPRGGQDVAAPAVSFAPSQERSFNPASARQAEDASMAALRSSAPAIEAALGDRQKAAPSVTFGGLGGLGGKTASSATSHADLVNAYTEYGRSRAASVPAPSLPSVGAVPAQAPALAAQQSMLAPATTVPTTMASFGPVPAALAAVMAFDKLAPQKEKTQDRRGETRTAAREFASRIGSRTRDVIGNAIASRFGGLGGLGGMFGTPTAASPFSVGTGLAAIQAVMGGGLPGATAYSASHPGASWSVNDHGLAEFTSAHGFTGVPPDGFIS